MIFIVGMIIVFFSGIVCVNCGDYEEMPITRYKQWLRDRNWFGKIYVSIAIIFSLLGTIMIYIAFAFAYLIMFIYIFLERIGRK